VLVVDDTRDVADSLAMLSETLGANVRVAYDGAQGLDELPEFGPEIVFLDIGMRRARHVGGVHGGAPPPTPWCSTAEMLRDQGTDGGAPIRTKLRTRMLLKLCYEGNSRAGFAHYFSRKPPLTGQGAWFARIRSLNPIRDRGGATSTAETSGCRRRLRHRGGSQAMARYFTREEFYDLVWSKAADAFG
jgi:CheY-like chemotaxis protein